MRNHRLFTPLVLGLLCILPNCSSSDSSTTPIPQPACGNGKLDGTEACDPAISTGAGVCPATCDDNKSCTIDAMTGTVAACSATCTHQNITECKTGDGCCAPGCNTGNDKDCQPGCGNGVIDPNETCDGDCPTEADCNDGNACTTDGITGSMSKCDAACSHTSITQCNGGDGCCPAGCNSGNDKDCSATCGNGVVDTGETCDGNCPSDCNDGNACTADSMTGSASTCSAACAHQKLTECTTGDGCCPAGCNNNSDKDCSASCGNLVVEAGESCDGNCPADCSDGNACTIDSMTGSATTCSAACNHQTITQCSTGDGCCPAGCNNNTDKDCSASCGNGTVESGETCDGNCPADCNDGSACTIDAMTGSAQNCNVACSHQNITTCVNNDGCCATGCTSGNDNDCSPFCGNGVIDPGETCDGNCPAACNDNNACTIDTVSGKASTCNVICTYQSITTCSTGDGCCPAGCNNNTDKDCSATCGNGTVEAGETCDGNCPTSCNDNVDCTIDSMTGSAQNCNVVCGHQNISQCVANDKCCPTGCTHSKDADCQVGAGLMGDPCLDGTADCASGACVLEVTDGWPGGYCSKSCTADADCGTGAHCAIKDATGNGICLKNCTANTDCRTPTYECYDYDRAGVKECAPVGNGAGAVGAPCTTFADCAGGQTGRCAPEFIGYRKGYCYTEPCSTTVQCGAGSHCSLIGTDGNGVCFKNCATNSDCRADGYLCFDVDGNSSTECSPAATGTGAIGAACTGTWECAGGRYGGCGTEANGWPGGYCTLQCDTGTGTCPAGSDCVLFTPNSFCLDTCAAVSECRANYQCVQVGGAATLECFPQ